MLKSADDDPGRNLLRGGKVADSVLAIVCVSGQEELPGWLGNEEVGCPFVCLSLISAVAIRLSIDVYALLAVEKDMRSFMEQTEPDLVI